MALLFLLIAVTLAPFWVMLATSLHSAGSAQGAAIPPFAPAWSNYSTVATAFPFGRFLVNTLIFSGAVVTGQLLTSVLAGYATARFSFPGRRKLLGLLVTLLVVPAMVLFIPRFLLLRALGWVDTLGGLISTELVSVWGILLMREAFRQLPRGLEEAARLDGAGHWILFGEIALPAVRPALVTLGLLAFVDSWRAYLWPLVATRSLDRGTVEVGLASFHGVYYSNWPHQMVAALITAVPLVLVFLLARRYFIRGLHLTGFR